MEWTTGGSWVDITPLAGGAVGVVTVEGATVVAESATLAGRSTLWTAPLAPLTTLLFLRAAADAAGHIAAIGQAHDGYAYVTREGGAPERLTLSFGVFPVEIRGLATGWQIAIFQSGRYQLSTLPLTGPVVPGGTVSNPSTQGFIQIDSGIVVTQDAGRTTIPGLILAERSQGAPTYAAGQNADAGPDRLRLTDNTRYADIYLGTGQPPHCITATDGSVWACSWTAAGAWVRGLLPADIPWIAGAPPGPGYWPLPPGPGPSPILPPGEGVPSGPRAKVAEPRKLRRQYPHVEGISDWRAQQTTRLLWDRVFDLEERLTATNESVGDLVHISNSQDDSLVGLAGTAGEALVLAQRSVSEGGGVGGDPGGPGGGGGGGGGTLPWTGAHQATLNAFAAAYPPNGADEDWLRDNWITPLCEQMAYSHPGEGWGHKRASSGRPPSSDVAARKTETVFCGYDVILGAGTASWSLANMPGAVSLQGQVFIPVSPVNHL